MTPYPDPTRARLAWALLALASLLAVGASSGGPAGGVTTEEDSALQGGVCRLLNKQDIERALNTPMNPAPAEAQAYSRPILVGMEMCGALSAPAGGFAEYSQPSGVWWGVLSQSTKTRLERYKRFNDPFLTPIKVSGQEALWDEGLSTIVVRVGNKVLAVRLNVEKPPVEGAKRRQLYIKKTAGDLAGRAMKRLENAG